MDISPRLADVCVVAKVNDVVWDLDRPFEVDSSLQLLKFDDPEAKVNFTQLDILKVLKLSCLLRSFIGIQQPIY